MNANPVELGERMHLTRRFSAAEVADFASLAGDHNPIHHSSQAAQRADFARSVVSGAQLSSILMGITATHFSRPGPAAVERSMLGLDFRFRFKRPVLSDETVEFSWQVVSLHKKPALGGDLVLLAGRVRNAAGEDAVKASGKLLVR